MTSLIVRPDIIRVEFEGMSKPYIVCAANVFYWDKFPLGYLIVPGPRHFSPIMNDILNALRTEHQVTGRFYDSHKQGFIDQFGNYYTREQALQVVKMNGQNFNLRRNGCDGDELFSEGLY
jgi:hypothetical protein